MTESPRTKSQRVIRDTATLLARRLFADPVRNEQICACWLRIPLNRSVDDSNSPIQALASLIQFLLTAPFDFQLRISSQRMFLLLFGNRPQICVPLEMLDEVEHKCVMTLSMFAKLCFDSGCQVIGEVRKFRHNSIFESSIDRCALVRGVCAASLQLAIREDRFRVAQTWIEAALTQVTAEMRQPTNQWNARLDQLCAEVRAQTIPRPSVSMMPAERQAHQQRTAFVQNNRVQWRTSPVE